MIGSRPDVIVGGGGATGCSIAYRLAERSWRVLPFERREIASGASGRNGEMTGARPAFHFREARAGDDGDPRRKGSATHLAVDTLGRLLALHVTPANERERDQVAAAFVAAGYTGEQPATDAGAHGIRLEVVNLPEVKRGVVLLPRRPVVERGVAGWRVRRLAPADEPLPETVAGLHVVALACLMLHRLLTAGVQRP